VALAAEMPSPRSLRRLEHEYSLAAELDPEWAARPLALTRHEGRTILILEDPGGEPLDLVFERDQGQPLDLTRFLRIAIGLATALGQVHRHRLIHKDIKPANVLVDDAAHVWLAGFGIASQLPHERQAPAPPSDRAAVPEPLSSLTMKLLAQKRRGALSDRFRLGSRSSAVPGGMESHGRIDSFPLGAHEASDRLVIPEKLYGREREINAVLAAFDRVVTHGTKELVLVSGYSGVGKSSVVNELHKALVPPRGLFASGKFDQYKRDIPYTTLAQAFQILVRQILVKSEAEVSQWRHALLEALGPNGQLIVNLIPEVEFIIGKQPSVPDLPPQDAQNRFQLVLRRFLGAFARPEHPLALFLDDLQWLDAATLDLLERLITDPDVRHLMLIGAT
jgi:serine/threonine protein kinase